MYSLDKYLYIAVKFVRKLKAVRSKKLQKIEINTSHSNLIAGVFTFGKKTYYHGNAL